jgi:uncharacterized protein YjiS (DUF1127 family)
MSNVAGFASNRGYSLMLEREKPTSMLSRVFGRVYEVIADGAEMHQAVRHLSGLDDALLKDIGVSRSDLERCVRYGR